jgi:MutS domain I.
MTIVEKLKRQSNTEVVLYKEGVFWIAYEESAYLVSRVKTLKPTKKIIKSVGKEVVSVGFPMSSLSSISSHFSLKEEKGDYCLVFEAPQGVLEEDFLQWKDGIELKIPVNASFLAQTSQESKQTSGKETLLLEKLKSFKLLQATPLQCVCFLEELQREFC